MKLLTCPFCGVAPQTLPQDPDREGNAWGAIQCENDRCATFDEVRGNGVRVDDGIMVCDERGTSKYIAAAAMRWNRRR